MSSKRQSIENANFGSRIAEDEVDDLQSYFVETEQWRKLLAGDVDVVFGAKGAGKSALYALLVAQRERLRLHKRTIFLAAENPRGAPAFRDITTDPPVSEEQFRALWKLYFLSIAAQYMRHALTVERKSYPDATEVFDLLSRVGLLSPNLTLIARLKTVLEYLRKYVPDLEASISEPSSGLTVTGKITLKEPTAAQRDLGYRSLDELLQKLDGVFVEMNITCWLALDRLDVAFAESPELERNALRSLFRTYLDMMSLSNIKVKIFLRDDIWRKIVESGFREASHVTRSLTISWNSQSLLNLLVRRVSSNVQICDLYGVDREDVLASAQLQESFFYSVFPDQVDVGRRQPSTLDWMLSRTADATKRTAPRELIHLLLEARDEQLKLYQLGNGEPEANRLFDRASLRSALPAVSKARYAQTLCAEYPALKSYLDKLEREKTHQTPATLAELWRSPEAKATEIAERLVEAGFFERRGTRDQPSYWVPFLYRDALDMVQGAA